MSPKDETVRTDWEETVALAADCSDAYIFYLNGL